jgi:hypothetical protein
MGGMYGNDSHRTSNHEGGARLSSWSRVPIEKGETHGFIKVAVDAETKHILGAAILGIGGDEVVHVLPDVMYANGPYAARHAYSSDGGGISPHRLIQIGTLCIGGGERTHFTGLRAACPKASPVSGICT